MRSLLLVLSCLGLGAFASGAGLPPSELAARLAAVEKTRERVEDKLTQRSGDLQARVRALYKLTRGGLTPLWVDAEARVELVERRAIARRVIVRDLEEVQLLRRELDHVKRDERALADDARRAAEVTAMPLAKVSFTAPVPGPRVSRFGVVVAKQKGLRLSHRGVEIMARSGASVRAPVGGLVRHVGFVRGLGTAVVLDHGSGIVAIVGPVRTPVVALGQNVARAAELGGADGDRVYLEIRRAGQPVDPELLFRASR